MKSARMAEMLAVGCFALVLALPAVAEEASVVKLCLNEASGELKAVLPDEECGGQRYPVTLAVPDCDGPWSVLTGSGQCLDLSALIASLQENMEDVTPRFEIQTQIRHWSGPYADADTPTTAPSLIVGDAAEWKYVVRNTAEHDLFDVVVRDSLQLAVICEFESIPAGAYEECYSSTVVQEGQSMNLGMVQAILASPNGDSTVTASNPAYYAGFHQKKVFVTSTPFRGYLGGVEGADLRCNTLAGEAGLEGTYMAWIASYSGDAPVWRFAHSPVPYVLVDGTRVADNWYDLVNGNLKSRIILDENGAAKAGNVWTNVRNGGYVYNPNLDCLDWNTAGGAYYGQVGLNTALDYRWSQYRSVRCNELARLYCFER